VKGDKVAAVGLLLAIVIAAIGLTHDWLTPERGAGHVMCVGQRAANIALARLALRRWLYCERDSGFWFRTMNDCLGDLSTACFDPAYCEGVRAAREADERGEQ
jgi:hypothetical protein